MPRLAVPLITARIRLSLTTGRACLAHKENRAGSVEQPARLV